MREPHDKEGYAIAVGEWQTLTKKLKSIKFETNYFTVFGGIFAGGSLATLIKALLDNYDLHKPSLMCWVIVIFTGLISIILFSSGRSQEQQQKSSIDHIIEIVDLIEKRCK